MMSKEEMKKRGLIFLEDYSLEEREKMEAERRERAKKRENYSGYAIDGLDKFRTMEEIDAQIDGTIKKYHQTSKQNSREK